MRSVLGVAASLLVLLAIPTAIVVGVVVGEGLAEAIIHFGVGTGFILLALAVFDFGLARWVTWLGAAAAGVFGGIFVLQGIADLVGDPGLHDFAFQILGQAPERVLPNVLFIWFAALLLTGTTGRSRMIGWIIVPTVIGLELAAGLAFILGIEFPFLKLHLFLPLVWLLIESVKAPAGRDRTLVGPTSLGNRTTATVPNG
jgi:hypothetical protein